MASVAAVSVFRGAWRVQQVQQVQRVPRVPRVQRVQRSSQQAVARRLVATQSLGRRRAMSAGWLPE